MKNKQPDFTWQKLETTQRDLATVLKHAYTVAYVDAFLRMERDDVPFFEAMQAELRDRGLLDQAHEFLAFERFRREMGQ